MAGSVRVSALEYAGSHECLGTQVIIRWDIVSHPPTPQGALRDAKGGTLSLQPVYCHVM